MKIKEKIIQGAVIVLASLLFYSCSGLMPGEKAAAINLVFGTDARTAFQRAATGSDLPWTKAEFTITENEAVSRVSVTNTGSSTLELKHTAKIGSTLHISVVIYRMTAGLETAVYSGTSDPVTVTGGINTILIRGIFKEDTYPLITVSFTVSEEFISFNYNGVGFFAFLGGERLFTDTADFSAADAGRNISFTFRAPVGAKLDFSAFMFRDKGFADDQTCRAADFLGTADQTPYTVKTSDNTVPLMPDGADLLSGISVKLDLNNTATLDLSALRNDVVCIPYSLPPVNGYVFCFRPKDFETLETLGLEAARFTRISGSAPVELFSTTPGNSGPWPFETEFTDSDTFTLYVNPEIVIN